MQADAVALLTTWTPPTPDQHALRRRFLDQLARHPDALSRSGPAAHLTASCIVLDPSRTLTLLVWHRKGAVWVQPGGHIEPGDATLADAAAREVAEETGLHVVPLLNDLHVHGLGAAFGSCTEHLDVTFVAQTPAVPPTASSESDAVAWWPVADLPEPVVGDLPARLARLTG